MGPDAQSRIIRTAVGDDHRVHPVSRRGDGLAVLGGLAADSSALRRHD
jgi:hypothetical protein